MENRSRIGQMQMRRVVSRYELGDLLGKGAYSEVFKARHLDNGTLFAVKVISNKVLADNEKVKECINNELAIHNILESGPHIVKFYELLQTKNNCYFVYQYCEGGTLHDLLKKEGALEQKRALEIFCQLLEGLKVLRKHSVMHRDLKPQNVLIKQGIFKLADFGFCKELGVQNMTRTMLGSPLYMAPQILRGEAYSVNADIWSVGVILYEMLYGYCPYQSNSIATLISSIQQKPLHFDPSVSLSPNVKRFISKCLQKDCRTRIGWEQFFEEATRLNANFAGQSVSASDGLQTPLEKHLAKIKELHSTLHSFEDVPKRSVTPAKTPSQMKSKFQLFKENYHKQTPSQFKNDHQTFVTIDNTQPKAQRSRSTVRNEYPKEKPKEGKIVFNQLVVQHESCLQALKACMEIMETKDRKQIVQVGSMLKGVRKILERIYTRINLEDVEMLPVLSIVKYEMIQVQKMQGEIEKWAGCTVLEPETCELPVGLSEPWAVLSTFC